jgi:hypothetical protein
MTEAAFTMTFAVYVEVQEMFTNVDVRTSLRVIVIAMAIRSTLAGSAEEIAKKIWIRMAFATT